VEAVTGEPFAVLAGDWALALVADSVPGVPRSRIPARYRLGGDRSLRELIVHGLGRPWPVPVRPAPAPGGSVGVALAPGSFDVFALTVPAGAPVALRLAPVGGGSFPARVEAQLGVLRLDP
jgi:hypothetical protein